MVLKGVPKVLSPDLMHALMSMGHGDEIVLADINFPAASIAGGVAPPLSGGKLLRSDGVDIPSLLDAILQFFPLDSYVKESVFVMKVVEGDTSPNPPPIWSNLREIIAAREGNEFNITSLERFEFYERAKKAAVVVATSETAQYSNVILKKGVVRPNNVI